MQRSKRHMWKWRIPARSGRGTPPTKMVFLGSRGWDPSITKSLSFRFHGRIWTCHTQNQHVSSLEINCTMHSLIQASCKVKRRKETWADECVCVCSHWPACLWWWGWTHRGTACRLLRCRHQSKPALSSHPGTAGRHSLHKIQQLFMLLGTQSIDKESCWNLVQWLLWLYVWSRHSAFAAGGHKLLQTDRETDKESGHGGKMVH